MDVIKIRKTDLHCKIFVSTSENFREYAKFAHNERNKIILLIVSNTK